MAALPADSAIKITPTTRVGVMNVLGFGLWSLSLKPYRPELVGTRQTKLMKMETLKMLTNM